MASAFNSLLLSKDIQRAAISRDFEKLQGRDCSSHAIHFPFGWLVGKDARFSCVLRDLCFLAASQNIPSDEELADFAAGRLSEERSRQIEAYLEADPAAEERWAAIAFDDPLIQRLSDSWRSVPSDTLVVGSQVLTPGDSVGRYVIRELRGRGGMGAVYRAHDPVIDREVALKVLAKESTSADNRALSEARAQGRVMHPHIVVVHDADQSTQGAFIAMELMASSLEDQLLRHGPFSVDDAIAFLVAAASGLQAAHEAGLIHRDIKPANLLLTADHIVKVADFGLARGTESGTVTDGERLAGTPHFMSPEQCRSEPLDARSDVYALGATFYTLLTGMKPYADSDSAVQVLFAQCESPAPDPCSARTDLPASCREIVERAMAKRPQDRYADVNKFAEALALIRSGIASTETGSDSSRQWRRVAKVPDGPSLAVVPFVNRSRDPEQEYFCDGVTEEIVAGLARFRELRVIGRNATATYKDQSADARQLGRDLGVDFVLEGSIRKSGARIRVSTQLVEAATGTQAWSESYDRDLNAADLFELQDDIAQRVAVAVGHPEGAALQQRRKAVLSQSPESLEAYDLILRWHAYNQRAERSTHAILRDRLEAITAQAVDLPDAYAALAFLYLDEFRIGLNPRSAPSSLDRSLDAARKAITLEPQSTLGLWALFCVHFHRQEMAEFRRTGQLAMATNPNHPDILADFALCLFCTRDWEHAVTLAEKAIFLTPGNPGWYQVVPMLNHIRLGQYEAALACARQCSFDDSFYAPLFLSACHGLTGNEKSASESAAKLLSIRPDFSENWQKELEVWQLPDEVVAPLLEGLKVAGVALNRQ